MKDGKIGYGFAPQVFTDAYVAAWNGLSENEKYYLVIEEINRGNCAQIFGDLFQLLDRKKETGYSEYPIKADNDLRDYLEHAKTEDEEQVLINKEGIKDGKLCLPPNLNIIATMNTSDQSLFPMDSAFKRRWSWEYVPIKYDEPKSAAFVISIPDSPFEKWVDFLKKINDIILEKTDSEDKQMGNFFIKGDIEEQEFKDKVMFYLWSEVCKDSFHTKDNFFRTKDRESSYNELYGDEGHDLLVGFLDYIKNYKTKNDQKE
jgi:5-methylcytosine-specific restriction endonuclease McrBC GTP-binding regulatory subunit McrB